MMFISECLAGLLTGASFIVAIGAQHAYLLRQGIRRNYVGTVVAICVIADVLLVCAGVAGVGAIVQSVKGLLRWTSYGGAFFLIGYGVMAGVRAIRGENLKALETTTRSTRWSVAIATAGVTFLNPHVYLDTVILLGSISARYSNYGRWFFALGAATASLLWFLTLGYGARLVAPLFCNRYAWRLIDLVITAIMLRMAWMLMREEY